MARFPTPEDIRIFKHEQTEKPMGQWSQRRCSTCGLSMQWHGPFDTPWDCDTSIAKKDAAFRHLTGSTQ